MFVLSSTVGCDQLVARQIAEMSEDRAAWHRDRSLDVLCFVRGLRARIDDQHVALLPQLVQLVGSDPARVVSRRARGWGCRSVLRQQSLIRVTCHDASHDCAAKYHHDEPTYWSCLLHDS